MKMKVPPIIIFVIILVLVAIGIFVFSMISSNGDFSKGNKISDGELIPKPILDLNLDNPEENQEKVTIRANASMEDGSAITMIVLPDNSEVLASEAQYEVTENGEYTFKAIAENGEETSVSIKVSNIKENLALNPYVPDGFKPVQGTEVETGFVIEDSYGNQYVWVPVENGQVIRETLLDSKYEESTSTASALVNSVAKNYGFYVGRYEASEYKLKGEKVAATMPGKIPWTNINYKDAAEYANNSAIKFEYENVNTAILNSYVWDTLLQWFDEKIEGYSTNINYGNYSGSIYPTGATENDIVYNICDIAGNVSEWTTEIYKNGATSSKNNEHGLIYRVIRGGSANLSRTPKSHTGYPEDTYEAYWGFRLILYK